MDEYTNDEQWSPISPQEIFEDDDLDNDQKSQLVETGGSIGIMILIVASLLIAGIVISIVVDEQFRTKKYIGDGQFPPPPPPGDSLTTTTGAGNLLRGWSYNGYDRKTKINCESDGRGSWVGNSCLCLAPFWGTNCQNEGYSNEYAEIGTPIIGSGSGEDTHIDVIDYFMADRLSFNYVRSTNVSETICTNICDETDDCVGVEWTQGDGIDKGACKLFSGIETSSIIPFNNSNNVGPTIYIKLSRVKSHIRIPNRVVLLNDTAKLAANKFEFGFVYRYWTTLRNRDMIIAKKGNVRSIGFVPTGLINQSELTGYYSLQPFVPDDILSDTNNFYIHYPDQLLAVPSSWYGLTLYVMYI